MKKVNYEELGRLARNLLDTMTEIKVLEGAEKIAIDNLKSVKALKPEIVRRKDVRNGKRTP